MDPTVVRIRNRYPDRIPVLVSPNPGAPKIDKRKFLAPDDMECFRFLQEIRRYIKVQEHETLFLFIGDPTEPSKMTLPNMSLLMGALYQQHKHTDGYLYIKYARESTFG